MRRLVVGVNLIHVEDAAAAVVAAAAAGPLTGRTYVVSDGHPPTRGEYAGWLAMQLGVARRCSKPGMASANACETLGPSTNWVYD